MVDAAKKLSIDGSSSEEILVFLRRQGCSKVEAIKILVELEGVPLSEAKRRVHCSRAWADTRQRDEEFHESIDRASKRIETAS